MLRLRCPTEERALASLRHLLESGDADDAGELSHWELLFRLHRRLDAASGTATSDELTTLLTACRDLSSAGEPWDGLMTEVGITQTLVRRISRLCGDGSGGEGDEPPETLLSLCSDTLANCSGATSRNAADVVYTFLPQESIPPVSCVVHHGAWAGVETAAVIWPCALVLSAILVERVATRGDPTVEAIGAIGVHGLLRVCELGCGLGLPSLALLQCFSGCLAHNVAYTMSDLNDAVLAVVRRNLASNGLADAPVQLDSSDLTTGTSSLDATYDVIFAADLIYDFALTASVAPALKAGLRPRRSDGAAMWTVEAVLRILTTLDRCACVDETLRDVASSGGVALLCCMDGRDSHDTLAAELAKHGLIIADSRRALDIVSRMTCDAVLGRHARFVAFYAVVHSDTIVNGE